MHYKYVLLLYHFQHGTDTGLHGLRACLFLAFRPTVTYLYWATVYRPGRVFKNVARVQRRGLGFLLFRIRGTARAG
jgi:hypothetical protein